MWTALVLVTHQPIIFHERMCVRLNIYKANTNVLRSRVFHLDLCWQKGRLILWEMNIPGFLLRRQQRMQLSPQIAFLYKIIQKSVVQKKTDCCAAWIIIVITKLAEKIPCGFSNSCISTSSLSNTVLFRCLNACSEGLLQRKSAGTTSWPHRRHKRHSVTK